VLITARHLLAESEDDANVAQVVLEPLGDLDVAEIEKACALLHDRDLGAECGEHRGVLDADDSCPYDNHRLRDSIEQEQPVGVEDRPVVERHIARVRRTCPARDHHPLRRDLSRLVARHFHGMRVEKAGAPLEDDDVVPQELVADDVDLTRDNGLSA
jgi:hypothetical protein